MREIDLIPEAYRTRRWQLHWVRNSALLTGVLASLLISGLFALNASIADARARVAALQHEQTVTAQQQADIDRLGMEKAELERQFRLLSGLRSGAAAEDMFITIDRALTDDNVWFLDWKFERAGVMVSEEIRTVNTGYFVVVPAGTDGLSTDEVRVQTHMSIRGQARDHSALSGFVRRLFAQPEIDDIRIQRTALNPGLQAEIVDFDLEVILNTDARGG